ncbi:hypothetical protein C7S18_09545 [Ahniella affigens]|uniref:Uncharacterized protein n=1 Tax=Ahniella affigens TaxID=2021234 RepID=A0A2P1PRF1_9GAMM|nr:hypothetical protein C7S18_09545 [Ahniella affigens]
MPAPHAVHRQAQMVSAAIATEMKNPANANQGRKLGPSHVAASKHAGNSNARATTNRSDIFLRLQNS